MLKTDQDSNVQEWRDKHVYKIDGLSSLIFFLGRPHISF